MMEQSTTNRTAQDAPTNDTRNRRWIGYVKFAEKARRRDELSHVLEAVQAGPMR
jgi:hypothetical protein